MVRRSSSCGDSRTYIAYGEEAASAISHSTVYHVMSSQDDAAGVEKSAEEEEEVA